MPLLTESIKQIKDECQETFADRRWNCNRINRIRHGNIPAELEKGKRSETMLTCFYNVLTRFRPRVPRHKKVRLSYRIFCNYLPRGTK